MQMDPASPRRPPIAQPGMPRGPPPPGSYYPGGAPDPRYRPRPPPQQYPPPLSAIDTVKSSYETSPRATIESESWPLPPRPVDQNPPRSNSPSKTSPRRPPQQRPPPPRPEYGYPPQDRARRPYRAGPPAPYRPGAPPRMSHHGSGQWEGDAYYGYHQPSSPTYSHHPPPRSAPPPPQAFIFPRQPPLPQQRNQRYPPNTGYRLQPAPAAYEAPALPVAQEPLDGFKHERSAEAAATTAAEGVANSSLPPESKNASNRVKYPSYYFDKDGDSRAPSSTGTSVHETHDSPMESHATSENGDPELGSARETTSPEPQSLIRQASLGTKTKPTLTDVTTADRRRDSSAETSVTNQNSFQHSLPRSGGQLTPFVEEAVNHLPGAWVSEGPTPADEEVHDDKSDTGSEIALATVAGAEGAEEEAPNPPTARNNDTRSSLPHLRMSNDWFRSFATRSEEDMHNAIAEDVAEDFPWPRHEERDSHIPVSPVSDVDDDETTGPRAISMNIAEALDFPQTGLSEKRSTRPADIDIGAVRDAESRGSMTSLPDLIRRATRLASNLDRGKTASRLGLNYFLNSSETDVDVEKYRAALKNRQSNDMLTAAPNTAARRSFGNFSSMLRHSQLPGDSDVVEIREKPPRRFCGMALWLVLVLAALLVLLIAAAVVIPVVLFVVPKQHDAAKGSLSPLAQCKQTLTCSNSGVNFVGQGNSCSCLCVNGYTGNTCTLAPATGCTTMSVSSATDATVGDNVSKLISSAQSLFRVPLDGETLLGLFANAGLDCSSENELVSFTSSSSSGTTDADVSHRNDRRVPGSKQRFASAAPSSPSASPTSPSPSPSSTASTGTTSLDFAGVSVLYILQESGKLETASTAQRTLQAYFANPSGSAVNAQNISLGNGFSCNLPKQRLVWTLGNGTTVGN